MRGDVPNRRRSRSGEIGDPSLIETVLRESEERFRVMADSAPVMIWASDTSKLCTYFNQPWLNFVGRSPGKELGYGWTDNIHQDDYELCLQTYHNAFDARRSFTMEYRLRRHDGQYRWLLDTGVPRTDAEGRFAGYIGSCVDITDRKQNEEQLRELKDRAEQDLRALQELHELNVQLAASTQRAEESKQHTESELAGIIESAMDAIVTIDSRQHIQVFNHAAEHMFGCSASDALGQSLDRFIPARFRDLYKNNNHWFGEIGVKRRPKGTTRLLSGIRADGAEFPIEASISQVVIGEQKLFTIIMRDISRRARAEEQIREQAALLEHARDAILVRDLQDRISYWNKGAEKIFGWSAAEIVGKNAREVLHSLKAREFDQAKQAVLNTGAWSGQVLLAGKDGREISVASSWTLVRDAKGWPKSILVIDTDITEKNKIEEQLFRAQRMESIGSLAGGIAHDLNNILSPIAMSVEMLRLKYIDEDSQGWLKILEQSVERGAAMVEQILSFARGDDGKRIEIQPRHLLVELVKLLRDTFPKNITVQFKLPGDLWTVTVEPTQLHQVLMNLSVNARDAMPEGGSLTLSARNHSLDENYVLMHPTARAGEFVRIEVTDTGTGMDRETLAHIFEPFFTTKAMGEGTGLGLSTTLAIVKSHGGFMDVESEVGAGTKIIIHLPASRNTSPLAETDDNVRGLPSGRGELVLVVDDEQSIRQITKSTLETFGYQVLTAADGTEALGLFAQLPDKIAVVITDVTMPFMDGVATIRALKKLRPNLKIICATAVSDEKKIPESVRSSVQMFLTKPHTAEMLLTALAEVLAS